MTTITHRDRITAVLAGNEADHLPIALWRHFPVDDQDADRLADATFNFQDTFNFDLVKVSPSSSFCTRDWGILDKWTGNTEGTRDHINSIPIEDLKKLKPLDPHSGSLGIQLKALEKIVDRYATSTHVIQTIFSPLSQLKNLIGASDLISAVRQHPLEVNQVLDVIVTSTLRFMSACQHVGADGFFFAVQHASADVLSREEFINYGKGSDEKLFDCISSSDINILHVHGDNIYFDAVQDYPCQIINWHDRDTSPALSDASKLSEKVFCGGLSRIRTMVQGSEKDIEAEIDDALNQVTGNKLIIGTGCVLEVITPYGNIKHAVAYSRK